MREGHTSRVALRQDGPLGPSLQWAQESTRGDGDEDWQGNGRIKDLPLEQTATREKGYTWSGPEVRVFPYILFIQTESSPLT